MPFEHSEEDDAAARFRQAMRGFASTVTIITAGDHERHHGMTATAVMPISMDPPTLAICIDRSRQLHDILVSARRFCVNVLDEAQSPVSTAFSGGENAAQRFDQGTWEYFEDGLGYLADAQSNMICEKAAAVPFGTHTLFFGTVVEVRDAERQTPLVYLNAGYCTMPVPITA